MKFGDRYNSVKGVIVEHADWLIPEYNNVKEAAMKAGALGSSISGSGPSIFALSENKETASRIGQAMSKVFTGIGIASNVFVSQVNKQGMQVLSPES